MMWPSFQRNVCVLLRLKFFNHKIVAQIHILILRSNKVLSVNCQPISGKSDLPKRISYFMLFRYTVQTINILIYLYLISKKGLE